MMQVCGRPIARPRMKYKMSRTVTATHKCNYCSFCSYDKLAWTKHLFQAHNRESIFSYVCGITSCPHEFKPGATFASFLTHCNRKHVEWRDKFIEESAVRPDHDLGAAVHDEEMDHLSMGTTNEGTIANDHEDDSVLSDHDLPVESMDISRAGSTQSSASTTDVEAVAGRFLLVLKEKYRVTQASLDFAVESVCEVLQHVTNNVRLAVFNELSEDGTIHSDVLRECFRAHDSPFANLKTEYQQTKFYKERFGYIEPITIQLGTSYRYQQCGTTRRLVEHRDTFQYIPLMKNLKELLKNSEVAAEVSNAHERRDGLIGDFCDGSFFKDHSLFQTDDDHSLLLQFILFYDEVEVTNPLGANRGVHKLAVFYYTLGNFHPLIRASLKSIQLIAIVTYPLLKHYGYRAILKPFIEEMNALTKGCNFTVNDTELVVKGAVIAMLADTLAAHAIGGYKVGVGFALRKCRNCLATKELMSIKFQEKDFVLRTPSTYDYYCSLLSGPLAEADSVTYGVNYKSILNELEYFHVGNGQLPQDAMHILLEGVVPYSLKLMLQSFIINKKYFSLNMLNERMFCFNFSHTESRDKPAQFTETILKSDGKVRQAAGQTWNLAIYLPLIIGDKIPENDSEWECFLVLLDILQICLTRILSVDLISYLQVLIEIYLNSFRNCYPSASIIPKQHYMVHFPTQIIKFGPLCSSWCMRMEAKNSFFKQIAQLGNFKNISLSVAVRHQKLLCAYLNSKDIFGKCASIRTGDNSVVFKHADASVQEQLLTCLPNINCDTVISRPNWIEWRGSKYIRDDYILFGFQFDDLPIFGKIFDIMDVGNKLFLYVLLYETDGIAKHYHSYAIRATTEKKLLSMYDNEELLGLTHPLKVHSLPSSPGTLYITTKSFVFKL